MIPQPEFDSIKKQKAGLRSSVKTLTAAFDDNYCAESDDAIFEALKQMPDLQNAKTVFCYVSAGREPDTRGIIRQMLLGGKTVCAPRCLGGGLMEARGFSSLDELFPGVLGILAPGENAPLVCPQDIDFVIAPCVAATKTGVRLGHGAGYYDNFLPSVSAPVVCLAREKTIFDFIPSENYDIMVDKVLTERCVYDCKE